MAKKNITGLREYKIVKSNDIIQKARFQLSTQEQKIILYLISKIKPTDKEFESYSFSIVEFCNICGINLDSGANYSNLKSTIKSLADKSLWVKLEKNKQTLVRWINKASILENTGIVEIRLDDDMKPYLLELKYNFTQYELLYTLAMKSQYSIRLYEILKSYEFKKTIIYEIENLKQILLAENYKLFGDFKRRVIDIAITEINNLSDISITYELIKEGRKYVKIKFVIKLKKDLDERLVTWKRIHEVIDPGQLSLLEAIDK